MNNRRMDISDTYLNDLINGENYLSRNRDVISNINEQQPEFSRHNQERASKEKTMEKKIEQMQLKLEEFRKQSPSDITADQLNSTVPTFSY